VLINNKQLVVIMWLLETTNQKLSLNEQSLIDNCLREVEVWKIITNNLLAVITHKCQQAPLSIPLRFKLELQQKVNTILPQLKRTS